MSWPVKHPQIQISCDTEVLYLPLYIFVKSGSADNIHLSSMALLERTWSFSMTESQRPCRVQNEALTN